MSGFINHLIEKERGATPLQVAGELFNEELAKMKVPEPVRYARQGDARKGEPTVVELGNSVDGYKEPVTPIITGAKKIINVPSARLGNGMCKIHDTPLTNQGRCLQKGCKYS